MAMLISGIAVLVITIVGLDLTDFLTNGIEITASAAFDSGVPHRGLKDVDFCQKKAAPVWGAVR
jgi:hypothetical protein